ncbi:MAG: hypothetical protein IPM85_15130 [Chitinophagaceae bacterium]|nr:hypothetical protein [Chitinophagaceae bacterium]
MWRYFVNRLAPAIQLLIKVMKEILQLQVGYFMEEPQYKQVSGIRFKYR